MFATDIAAVYNDTSLTIAVRPGGQRHIPRIERHENVVNDTRAFALLLRTLEQHWRELPQVTVTGNGAARLVELTARPDVAAYAFDWTAAPDGGKFSNRGSEWMDRIKSALREGAIIPDVADMEQLAREAETFELSEGQSHPRYTLPEVVDKTLAQYPAVALVFMLVNQHPRPLSVAVRRVERQRTTRYGGAFGHDPFAPLGHDPFAVAGHRPF